MSSQAFLVNCGDIRAPAPAGRMQAETRWTRIARVGDAPEEVRWRTNKDEPDSFIERMRPVRIGYGDGRRHVAPSAGPRPSPTAPSSSAHADRRSS